jgi:predicted transcriptional regulator
MADNTDLSIQMKPGLKERLEAIAQVERRSPEDEAAYLVETGVRALEGWEKAPGEGP